MRTWGAIALGVALASCVGAPDRPRVSTPRADRPSKITPNTPLPPVTTGSNSGPTASSTGVAAGPAIDSLPISEAQAEAARAAFVTSCPGLMRRADASGLTRGADWQQACTAARSTARGQARTFFAANFEAVQVGDGRAFATGYYIPEIAGSRTRRKGYDVPVYGRPTDLVDVDLGKFSADLKGKKIRGRVDGSNFVPYFDRTAIEGGALKGRAPIIAWAADSVEMFFLQIQGSGLLKLPDGSVLRIGYDSQNGRDYTGIGALMKARGLLAPGQTSMQGIVAWLHAHPDEGAAIMRENKSFVFFRVLEGDPVGALGYPVIGKVSAAADPKFVPLGAPVFLSLDRADATGLWIVQDTGGAIRGPNRIDTFWGAGDTARATAGGMSARGTGFVLVPIGTAARLNAVKRDAGTTP